MSPSANRVDGVLSGPDSRAVVCRGISSGVLVGLGLVVATHALDVDGGRTVIRLGYAVVAGLAVGEVLISHPVRSDDGPTAQSKSCRSLRAVGATVGVALTVFPFTLQPLVVDMVEAVVGSMAVGGATLLGAGWFLGTRPESDDDRQLLRVVGAGVLVVVLAVVLSL
jgi:VIT1/CCC1 family predicted Fe2+/Mn2+ transporter